jgi:Xaa-Pro aminopeptidase
MEQTSMENNANSTGSQTLIAEKVQQAIAIMNELDIDLWLNFTQETGDGGDPVYPMIFGERDLGRGLLLLTRQGDAQAIVGGLDVAIPPATGIWKEVVEYNNDFKAPLLDALRRFKPDHIAINYSLNNPKADGLSYGNYLRLTQALASTTYLKRLVSAETLITRLRGRKSPAEVELIRASIAITDDIFRELGSFLRPGRTGREIYNFLQQQTAQRGLRTSWSSDHCPVVTVGPVPSMGHTPPGDEIVQKGWTLQVDFGVQANGYCSDFQRMWYFLEDGESRPPAEVQRLFDVVRAGVDTVIDHLRPGNPTWLPNAAARELITAAGYPEFKYTVGHQLGRATHDGGQSLARRRENVPDVLIESGNVYTAEGLETRIEGRGWISLEEDVLVTDQGPRVLTTPQRELWLVK